MRSLCVHESMRLQLRFYLPLLFCAGLLGEADKEICESVGILANASLVCRTREAHKK